MPGTLLIASGPVIVEQGAVLLVKHGDDPFWKFPGGRLYGFEETLRDVAIRIAKEEVDIDITCEDREPFLMYIRRSSEDSEIDVILVHFVAHRVGEGIRANKVREYAWLPIDQLPEDVGPNIKPALQFFEFLR